MTTKREPDDREALTDEELMVLCDPIAFAFAGDLPGSENPFDSAEERRRAWEEHREEVYEYMERQRAKGYTTGKLNSDQTERHPFAYFVYEDDVEPDESEWRGQLPEERWEDC